VRQIGRSAAGFAIIYDLVSGGLVVLDIESREVCERWRC
jgi:hypothetical protein